MNPLIARLMPFVALVILLVFLVVSIFIFSYVFLFALIVGCILFVIGLIRAKFGSPAQKNQDEQIRLFIADIEKESGRNTKNTRNTLNSSKGSGRIIEHDE